MISIFPNVFLFLSCHFLHFNFLSDQCIIVCFQIHLSVFLCSCIVFVFFVLLFLPHLSLSLSCLLLLFMFGLCPNIMIFAWFFLVFFLFPMSKSLFLLECVCNQLAMLTQFFSDSQAACYIFFKNSVLFLRIYSGFSWSPSGSMSNFDGLFLLEFLFNRLQALPEWSLGIEVLCYDFLGIHNCSFEFI